MRELERERERESERASERESVSLYQHERRMQQFVSQFLFFSLSPSPQSKLSHIKHLLHKRTQGSVTCYWIGSRTRGGAPSVGRRSSDRPERPSWPQTSTCCLPRKPNPAPALLSAMGFNQRHGRFLRISTEKYSGFLNIKEPWSPLN